MSFYKYDKNGNQIRYKKAVIDCQAAINCKDNPEEVRVEQNHEPTTNINMIVKNHGLDLIQKTANVQQLTFDDVTTNDFQEAMMLMMRGKETFMSLPSDVRKEFDHDPAKYLDYVHNPENHDAMIERGWIKSPPSPPEPTQVVVMNPETPPEEIGAG